MACKKTQYKTESSYVWLDNKVELLLSVTWQYSAIYCGISLNTNIASPRMFLFTQHWAYAHAQCEKHMQATTDMRDWGGDVIVSTNLRFACPHVYIHPAVSKNST